jgi:hypothetical protein
MVNEAGEGRYSRTLPPGVSAADVLEPRVSATDTPITDLLTKLVQALSAVPPPNRHGYPGLDDAVALSTNALAAIGGEWGKRLTQSFQAEAVDLMLTHTGSMMDDMRALMGRHMGALTEGRRALRVDGAFTAIWMILSGVWQAIDGSTQLAGRPSRDAESMRYFSSLIRNTLDIRPLVGELVNRALRGPFYQDLVGAAESNAVRGDELIEIALQGPPRLNEFYWRLFEALPFEVAASDLYWVIGQSPYLRVDDATRMRLAKAHTVADEKSVRIGGSLVNSVLNFKGIEFQAQRSRIQAIMGEKGRFEGEQKAMEYTDLLYYYPRAVKPMLLASDS